MYFTDKVHNQCYLFAQEIDLSLLQEDSNILMDLRPNEEILSASIEVLEAGTGTASLGTDLESKFFLGDVDLGAKEVYKTKKECSVADFSKLVLETAARDGKIKVKMLFFTAGQINY